MMTGITKRGVDMNDLKVIKQKILDEGLVEEILNKLECQHVRRENNRLVAQLPERFGSGNTRNVVVYLDENLKSYIFSRGVTGDIYNVVSYIITNGEKEEDIYRAKKWICANFGLKGIKVQNNIRDPLRWLKDIKKKYRANEEVRVEPNKVYPERILNDFIMLPWKPWIEEGIDYQTQIEFEIGIDLETQRVIFPVRNKNGELIGIKGRTITDDKAKYLYLYECNKSIELFNLHRALPYIKQQKEVIVFEGAKSCMKAWSMGVRNTVSIEGGNMSLVQIKLLLDLGFDIEIILAFDKDKTADEEEMKKIQKYVDSFVLRKVSMIIDDYGYLGEKDSPVDKGVEVWEKLYRSRVILRKCIDKNKKAL